LEEAGFVTAAGSEPVADTDAEQQRIDLTRLARMPLLSTSLQICTFFTFRVTDH
jgi:hypothetical protein